MCNTQNPTKRKAPAGQQGAYLKRTYYSSKKGGNTQSGFDKNACLSPSSALGVIGIKHISRGTWLSVYCPFHKEGNEQNPSLSMHAQEGFYKCHACGAKGGDLIAFYRALTNASFNEALRLLGGHHA